MSVTEIDRNAEIFRLKGLGYTHKEIGMELHISRNSVCGVLWRAGYRLSNEEKLARALRRAERERERYRRARELACAKARERYRRREQWQPKSFAVESVKVRLVDREPDQCCWPLDERSEDGLWLFCGNPKHDHRWCEGHCRVGYLR